MKLRLVISQVLKKVTKYRKKNGTFSSIYLKYTLCIFYNYYLHYFSIYSKGTHIDLFYLSRPSLQITLSDFF